MSLITRVFDALAGRTRSLDAAGSGRRWPTNGSGKVLSTNQDIQAGGRTVAQRAAYYCRNDSHASAAVAALVAHAVGCGIKPRSKHPDPAVRAQLHDLWSRWCETGANGQDFNAALGLAVRSMVEAGEAFAQFVNDDTNDAVPLSVVLIDPSQVPANWTWDIKPGNLIRSGIEFAPNGRPVAFNVLPQNPSDPWLPLDNIYQPVRVPAEDIVHMFRPVVAGQVRGLSWLAPVVTALRELGDYRDATLAQAKTAALFTGFITDPSDDAAGLAMGASADSTGAADVMFEPGTIATLPPGSKIEFSKPPDNPNFSAFCVDHLKEIAVGIGVQYSQISGDLREANYSSMRAGLIEFRRSVEQLQHTIIIPQFLRRVWRRWVKTAVLSGAIDAPDFFTNPTPYFDVEWFPPSWAWVDPAKDVAATVEAINAGIMSRTQAIAEEGYDSETLDAEIAADRAREKAMGLTFTVPSIVAKPQVPEAQQPREASADTPPGGQP